MRNATWPRGANGLRGVRSDQVQVIRCGRLRGQRYTIQLHCNIWWWCRLHEQYLLSRFVFSPADGGSGDPRLMAVVSVAFLLVCTGSWSTTLLADGKEDLMKLLECVCGSKIRLNNYIIFLYAYFCVMTYIVGFTRCCVGTKQVSVDRVTVCLSHACYLATWRPDPDSWPGCVRVFWETKIIFKNWTERGRRK